MRTPIHCWREYYCTWVHLLWRTIWLHLVKSENLISRETPACVQWTQENIMKMFVGTLALQKLEIT